MTPDRDKLHRPRSDIVDNQLQQEQTAEACPTWASGPGKSADQSRLRCISASWILYRLSVVCGNQYADPPVG